MTIVSSPTPPLASPTLSSLLREGSHAEHREAEGSSFMTELLAGRVSREGYAVYLSCLRRVYAALEGAAAGLVSDPLAGAVIDPSLERLAAIDADLEFWGGFVEHASPATDAYVSRIQQASSWGGTFVAHHYTRYLGDLSGGLARVGQAVVAHGDLQDRAVADHAGGDVVAGDRRGAERLAGAAHERGSAQHPAVRLERPGRERTGGHLLRADGRLDEDLGRGLVARCDAGHEQLPRHGTQHAEDHDQDPP